MVFAKRNKDGQIVLNKKIEEKRHKPNNHLFEFDYKTDAEKVTLNMIKKIEQCFEQYKIPEYMQYEELPHVGTLFGTHSQFMLESIDIRICQYKSIKKQITSEKRQINQRRNKFLSQSFEGTEDEFYFNNVFKELLLKVEEQSGYKLRELSKLYQKYNEDMKTLIQLRKIYEEKSKTDNVILTPQDFEELRKKESAKEI